MINKTFGLKYLTVICCQLNVKLAFDTNVLYNYHIYMNALNCINKKHTYDYFHILICFLHDILDFCYEIMSCKITILLGQ